MEGMDFAARFPSLAGKVAVVTGASRGIGQAVVNLFVRESVKVVACHHRTPAPFHAEGVCWVRGDVTQPLTAVRSVEAALEHFGRIDILVNNAGAMPRWATFAECDEELWDETIRVNLGSAFLFAKAVVPHFERQGGGCIVNISSILARLGGSGGALAYAAAKGGMETFTIGLAVELAPSRIRVNAVAPGLVDTEFHAGAQERFSLVESKIPWNRAGRPEEVAQAIAFVASDAASYMTGSILTVSGGR